MAISKTKSLAAVLLLAAGSLSLTACGSAGGGDTTCGDYMGMSGDDQKAVIKNFFAEKGDSDPAAMEVTLSQQSAKLYCSTVAGENDPISGIDG